MNHKKFDYHDMKYMYNPPKIVITRWDKLKERFSKLFDFLFGWI